MAVLTALTGPLAGERFELAGELVIGRESADIRVPDPEVSRRHAELRPVPGGVEVTDLGSLNGTWMDEQRIARPVVVRDGAVLRVGETSFRVNAQDPPALATADAPVRPPGAQTAASPPVGGFAPAPGPRARRSAGAATRLWMPAAMSFAAIVATAIALLLYFAVR